MEAWPALPRWSGRLRFSLSIPVAAALLIACGAGDQAPRAVARSDGQFEVAAGATVAEHVRTIDAWFLVPRPTTPESVDDLRDRIVQLEWAVRRTASSTDGERTAAALATYRRRVARALIVWTAESTLADLRRAWNEVRDAELGMDEPSMPGTRKLDAAHRVREPDVELDLHGRIRACERQLLEVETLARELEKLPEEDRYRPFATRAHQLLLEVGVEARPLALELPPRAPDAIRGAWRRVERSRALTLDLLGSAWVRDFMEHAPTAAAQRAALQEARDGLEVFYDEQPLAVDP